MLNRLLRIAVLIIISVFLISCPNREEDIILPGDIKGIVTDAETSEPIYKAKVGLNTPDDTTSTGIDGSYLLKNIDPDNYEIQASKFGYATKFENVRVESGMIKTVNFNLPKISTITVSSTFLDFGIDSTKLKFKLSKNGIGILTYDISTSQSWITTSPPAGYIAEETDTITVTVNINKTIVPKTDCKETITVSDQEGNQEVKIDAYVNGLWFKSGSDSVYKYIVRIGTQVWMGENENVGTRIDLGKQQTDNGIIEKYCYSDGDYNCDTYGGLYQWDEMMQYNPAEDTGKIPGTTQGICPKGWHIPTDKEWRTLQVNLGGESEAGGKLKEIGFAHWASPNAGATNESGFTGLPGGFRSISWDEVPEFGKLGVQGGWWTSNLHPLLGDMHICWLLSSGNADFIQTYTDIIVGLSVRCIRNP
jgi:uncharacterized protein (TIGR02145 family)